MRIADSTNRIVEPIVREKVPYVAAGLLLAFLGPPLIAVLVEKAKPAASSFVAPLIFQFALIAVCAGVVGIVRFGERRPLSSIGLRPPLPSSILWGLALAGFFIFVFAPVAYRALELLKLGGFEAGIGKVREMPLWLRVFAVLAGGAIEEILYRGYAVDRLASLTGSYFIGGGLSVVAFGLAHLPMWGWGPSLTTFVSGAILTFFYIWKRDLSANIVAHVGVDFVGLVLSGP